jgi:hypothetical protein
VDIIQIIFFGVARNATNGKQSNLGGNFDENVDENQYRIGLFFVFLSSGITGQGIDTAYWSQIFKY